MEFWFEKNLPTGTTIPAVNIKENNENFTVEMAKPVMNENDFKVEVNGNMLIITSKKIRNNNQRRWSAIQEKSLAINLSSARLKEEEQNTEGQG